MKLVHLVSFIIKKLDDSFQFEFLIRLKLYTSVFLNSVQFTFFLFGKQRRNAILKHSSTTDSSVFRQHARAKRRISKMKAYAVII